MFENYWFDYFIYLGINLISQIFIKIINLKIKFQIFIPHSKTDMIF